VRFCRSTCNLRPLLPGRELAQIRRTGHGEATALVRRVEDTGMSRLLLYKLDGKWFVDQMTACQPNR
jgi:hypothetical protein